jgi:hypothetical protein
MGEEKGVESAESGRDESSPLLDDTSSPDIEDSTTAESGIIISNDQVQSIDISDKFTRRKTPEGWSIALHRPCKVTINLATSLRKLEANLMAGDLIVKDGADVMILRKHSANEYKLQRSSAPLARSREELLSGEATST